MNLQQKLNADLARELFGILKEPAYIYVNSLEPAHDKFPVPRYLVEGMTQALALANKKISTLEDMTKACIITLQELVIILEKIVPGHPAIAEMVSAIGKVEQTMRDMQ